MCGCECCIYEKLYIPHYYHGVIGIKPPSKIKAKILKTEGMAKKKMCIYETYKNTVILHGHHIYANTYDMSKATMCAYKNSDNKLLHWKYVLQCCAKFTCVNLLDQETDDQYSNKTP